jgi:hypothetical protein
MMRLANSSRVAADSGPAASVLPDALSNFHAVSNAAAKRSFVSGSNVVFASSGIIDKFHSLPAGAQWVCQPPTPVSVGDPELCAYWCNLASAISDVSSEAQAHRIVIFDFSRRDRRLERAGSPRNAGKISFRPKGARSRREPRQSASVVVDPAPRASPQRD